MKFENIDSKGEDCISLIGIFLGVGVVFFILFIVATLSSNKHENRSKRYHKLIYRIKFDQ